MTCKIYLHVLFLFLFIRNTTQSKHNNYYYNIIVTTMVNLGKYSNNNQHLLVKNLYH